MAVAGPTVGGGSGPGDGRMPAALARLRICMLAACPFPANHGTPGSIRELAEAVAQLGHEVEIVTYHLGENIPVNGPRLHRIVPLTRESAVVVGPTIRRPLYDLQMVFTTLRVVRRSRPHLLHAHGYEAALVAAACRVLTRLPVVYSAHNTMADELPTYGFIRPHWLAKGVAGLLDRIVPRLADRCLPHSSNVERFLRERGLGARTHGVVNFGIDVDWMARGNGEAVRAAYGLEFAPVILYAGVLDHFQRLDLLLAATAYVARRCPRVRLLVVVTIPQAHHVARLRALAEQFGVSDRLVVTDPRSLEEVRDSLQAADVAVVPRPAAPGFPIKLLNYMAAARACALFASSASAGVVHRQHAMLASPDTAEALGQTIVELLENSTLREAVARNGYEFVRRHHDRRAIAQEICECYGRVLAREEPGSDECHVYSS